MGRQEGRKQQGHEMRKWNSSKDKGVYDHGAFKLDHLQPVNLILYQNVHLFNQPPIINHCCIMGRQEGRKLQGQKMRKWNSSKVDETKRS